MSSTPYIIQWQQDTSYCLGINQAAPNNPVVLTFLSGPDNPFTQWQMDPNTGFITSVADDTLFLDIQGVQPKNGTPLIVTSLVPGRTYQQWNWLGSPGRIMNIGAPNFYADNQRCRTTLGNTIQLYDSGGKCQWWNILFVRVLEFTAIGDREAAIIGD